MTYRTQHQISSGGVIVRQQAGQPQVCLISRRQRGQLIWGLPKGHVERGENLKATAVREVREETGLLGEPVARLGSIAYWFAVEKERVRYFKRVHFYLLRYREGKTHRHDHEVEQAVWLPIDEALTRLSYESERKVLQKAQRYLEKGEEG